MKPCDEAGHVLWPINYFRSWIQVTGTLYEEQNHLSNGGNYAGVYQANRSHWTARWAEKAHSPLALHGPYAVSHF